MTIPSTARLTGIVVHWHAESELRKLVAAWPGDPDLRLLVVDNGSTRPLPTGVEILGGERNLGFAGAVNLGLRTTESPLVLILNPDVCPRPGAIAALLRGFERFPDAAGLAPRLVGSDGRAQWAWQLRSLPTTTTLLMQCLFLPASRGARTEPVSGEAIEQPAGAALCLRRDLLAEMGGLDESFYPAWFEDVDLARRLNDRRQILRYCPEAVFEHRLGVSVERLGYGRFLSVYYANLCRYLAKHHGALPAGVARAMLLPAALTRLALLPLRRPKRASTRTAAARGLIELARSAGSGFPEAGPEPPASTPTDEPAEGTRAP